MKTFKLLSLFLSFSVFAFAQDTNFEKQQFIAKLKPGVALEISQGNIQIQEESIQQLNTLHQIDKIERVIKSKPKTPKKNRPATDRLLLFSFQNNIDVPAVIEAYTATGIFDYVEPNYIGTGAGVGDLDPNDSFYYNRQWSLFNDGTFDSDAEDDADVDMELAWDISTGNVQTVIAILDSGFRLSHPEFDGRFWNNVGDAPDNLEDDDNNGYTDDQLGWDFINDDNDPTDDHGHGTNVASIMAATGDNGIGFAGVNWKAKVMIGKILNQNNSGSYSGFTEAVYYAVDNGAEVINMSVGGSGFSQALKNACEYAHANDVLIAVSMMNTNNNVPYYPAAYTTTIAVGSTDTNDERTDPFFWNVTSGSNYGSHIDIIAPGNFIYGLAYNSDNNYNTYWGGTSQATPIVAGVASLLKGINPAYTVEEIREILRSTSEDEVGKPSEDTPGWDEYHGAGRLNAHEALLAATEMVSTQELSDKNTLLQLNPNPVLRNGTLNLELQTTDFQEFNISMLDASGKLLFNRSYNFSTDTEALKAPSEAGIYFLKIETNTGLVQTIKFIVTDF